MLPTAPSRVLHMFVFILHLFKKIKLVFQEEI